jgi:hypothetical protein
VIASREKFATIRGMRPTLFIHATPDLRPFACMIVPSATPFEAVADSEMALNGRQVALDWLQLDIQSPGDLSLRPYAAPQHSHSWTLSLACPFATAFAQFSLAGQLFWQ